MKKIISLILIAALALTFGCQKSTKVPKRRNAFEKAVQEYGYKVSGEEDTSEKGLGAEGKDIKDAYKKMIDNLSYTKEEKTDFGESTAYIYFVSAKDEKAIKKIEDYYSDTYSQMEEAKKEKTGNLEIYKLEDECFYIYREKLYLIKGQCHSSSLKEVQKITEEVSKAEGE